MVFVAGQRPTAAELNLATQTCVWRYRRSTAGTTTTTTAQGYVRLDDIPLQAGYLYGVRCTGVHPQSSVAADAMQADIYYTVDGSTPTTSSAILDGSEFFQRMAAANSAETSTIDASYTAGSGEILSLLVAYKRISGTGNISFFGSADASFEITVVNLGVDPGSTGTSI